MSYQTITDTIDQALRSAGLGGASGPGPAIADTLRRAFGAAGMRTGAGDVVKTDATLELVERVDAEAPRVDTEAPRAPKADAPGPAARPGRDTLHHFESAAGKRDYRLYVPAALPEAKAPLVMMLHGCKQSAADFATGTRMNRLADRLGFIVVYPEQSARANGSNCWNWFQPGDQVRGAGEPELLAGIAREVIGRHPVDDRRVFVAGLSAGASMAVILGVAYPELFAGVGAHSGLPYASAHDMGSAFAAMSGRGGHKPAFARDALPVRTIVFHGDADHTVANANGDAILAQALTGRPLQRRASPPVQIGGRLCDRTVYLDAEGREQAEQWVVHGAGHAWSGGDTAGSFTDAHGPDASAEMMRFFLER